MSVSNITAYIWILWLSSILIIATAYRCIQSNKNESVSIKCKLMYKDIIDIYSAQVYKGHFINQLPFFSKARKMSQMNVSFSLASYKTKNVNIVVQNKNVYMLQAHVKTYPQIQKSQESLVTSYLFNYGYAHLLQRKSRHIKFTVVKLTTLV